MLAGKDVRFRHGEDADFDAELGLEKRIDDYSALSGRGARASSLRRPTTAKQDELDVAVGENDGRRSLVQRLTGADKDKTPVASG